MTELYLTFFLVGIGLFCWVVAYSVLRLRYGRLSNIFMANRQIYRLFNSVTRKFKKRERIAPEILSNDPQHELGSSITSNTEQGDTTSTAQESKIESKLFTKEGKVEWEWTARIKNEQPIYQERLLQVFREHDFKFASVVRIFGYNQSVGTWRNVELENSSASFVHFALSIELANKKIAMSEREWHDFQQMVMAFSNTFDAAFEFSMELDVAYQQAQMLHQLSNRYNVMVVLRIVPKWKGSGFKIADIENCARDQIMSSDGNGTFVKTSGYKNNVLFRMTCAEELDKQQRNNVVDTSQIMIHKLMIYLIVPTVENPSAVFQQMAQATYSIAKLLRGEVTDDNGYSMGERRYEQLAQQVTDMEAQMAQHGLNCGDTVCKQIF